MRTLEPVSWEGILLGVEKVRQRLMRAAQALDSAAVPYAVVGGNAVAAWVSRVDVAAVRNTRDVDILLRRCDLERAQAALNQAGFLHRRIANLGRTGTLDVFLDGPQSSVRDALHLVFAAEKVLPQDACPTPDVTDSEPIAGFRLVSLEALVRMKLAAFRDKDRVHLRDLVDVGLIDRSWPDRLDPALATRLQQILDSPDG